MQNQQDYGHLSQLGSLKNPSTLVMQTLDAFVDIYTGCKVSKTEFRPWSQIKVYFEDP